MPSDAGLNPDSTSFADVDLHAMLTGEEVVPEEPPVKPATDEKKSNTEKSTPEPAPPTSKTEKKPESKAEEASTETSEEDAPAGEDESSLVEELARSLGYSDLLSSNTYSDDIAGVTQFVEDAAVEFAKSQIEEHFSDIPDVAAYYEYRLRGGKPEQFFQTNHPTVDYEGLKIQDGDVATQRSLVVENLKLQGIPEEQINTALTAAESGGTLKHFAEVARLALANRQKQAKTDFAKQQESLREQRARESAQLHSDVRAVVDKGAIQGLQISAKEKEAFIEYVLSPVKGELTQRDLDAQKFSLENELLLAWIQFNGFDVSKFIQLEAKTANAHSLRDRLTRNAQKGKPRSSADAAPKPSSDGATTVDEVDLAAMYEGV